MVYDYINPSPYYSADEPYIDERDAIELLPIDMQQQNASLLDKKVTVSPLQPYVMEMPPSYSMKNGRGCPRMNRYYTKLQPYYRCTTDETLQFESRFESGNLNRAIKVSDTEYDLYLKNDYGTTGYTQWYFF